MKKAFRASALLLLVASFARPAAAQTPLPPITSPEFGTTDDTTQVNLQLLPDSLVAEPAPPIDLQRLAWLQTPPELRDLISDRVGCIDTDMPCNFNGTVLAHINYFTQRNRTYMQRVLERENLYFPIFEKYLAKYNLPQDLKYLAVVESALIPTAKSRVGATGLWQFMGPTANDLRLRRDEWVDERMNPEKATEAACKHLRFLYGMFHDWELVLAAYNWGPGNVQRVMRRTGKKNYWDLHPHMPQETRNYVPSFTAIMYAMKYAQQHQLNAPELKYQYAQPMDTLQLGGQAFDMTRLSQALGLDSVAVLRMNPELRKPYLPEGYRPYAVLFPASLRPQLQVVDRNTLFGYCRPQAALPTYIAALPPRLTGVEPFPTAASGAIAQNNKAPAEREASTAVARTRRKVHSVRRGQTLAEIADWYGVSQSQLRRWNNLPKGRPVKAKQQLVVFLPAKETESATKNVAVRPAAAPAVAAVPRTPAEMGVKVTKVSSAPAKSAAESIVVEQAPTVAAVTPAPASPAVAARPQPRASRQTPEPTPAAALETATTSAVDTEAVAAPTPALTEYVVRKGDNLSRVAREQNLSVTQLIGWNKLPSEALSPGQKLRLTAPTEAAEPAAEAATARVAAAATTKTDASDKSRLTVPNPAQRRVHVVQPGDTLYNISRRYQGLTVEQLRKLNGLKSDDVKPGQKLIVAS